MTKKTETSDTDSNAEALLMTNGAESDFPDEVLEALAFDPFAGGEDGDGDATPAPSESGVPEGGEGGTETPPAPEAPPTQQQPAAAEPAAGEPGASTPPTPAPVPQPATQPPAASPSPDHEMALLRQQVQNLKAQVQQAQAQPAQGQPASGTAPQAPAVPGYDYNIPQEIVSALQSDDPTQVRNGLAALIKGVSQNVHATVAQEFQSRLDQVPQTVQQQIDTRTRQQEIYNDFFRAHPDLNRPEILPIISQQMIALSQELGVTQWSDHVRDAVATRVRTALQSWATPQPAATPPLTSAPAPAPNPPVLVDPGTRPAGVDSPNAPSPFLAALGL